MQCLTCVRCQPRESQWLQVTNLHASLITMKSGRWRIREVRWLDHGYSANQWQCPASDPEIPESGVRISSPSHNTAANQASEWTCHSAGALLCCILSSEGTMLTHSLYHLLTRNNQAIIITIIVRLRCLGTWSQAQSWATHVQTLQCPAQSSSHYETLIRMVFAKGQADQWLLTLTDSLPLNLTRILGSWMTSRLEPVMVKGVWPLGTSRG